MIDIKTFLCKQLFRKRRNSLLVAHLLRHPRDVLGGGVAVHAHQDVDAAEVGFDAAVGHHTLVGEPSPDADGRARALVSELALQALRAFPTTTVEDEAVLGGATDKRTSAAVAYRLGVKRRLQTFVGQLRFREYNS